MSARIAFAAEGLGGTRFHGGPTNSRVDALVALLACGGPVHVISNERGELPGWTQSMGLGTPDWMVLPSGLPLVPRIDVTLPGRLVRWWRDAWAERSFQRTAAALHPDILWVEGHSAHRMLALNGDWPARRRVLTMRGSPDQFTGRYRGEYELDRAVRELKTYDAMITVSRRVGAMWTALPELAGLKTIYLPNCAREEDAELVRTRGRDEIRRSLGWRPDELIAVCPGTVQYRKGQDLLVHAMAALRDEFPSLRAILVGDVHRGRGGDETRELARSLHVENAVEFAGHRANVLDYIFAADLLAFPSREEAMPLAVLESMVLGTPVVASNVCGIPELLDDEVEGLLFDHAEPDRFTAQLRRLASDPVLRERLSTAARSKYLGTFARRHQMARYRDAVKELMS